MKLHFSGWAARSEGAASTQGGRGGLEPHQWNALIGIVTAIVGNVLISFALNIQRYAHIRLSRQRGLSNDSWKGKGGYNAQAKLAEERAKFNLRRVSNTEPRRLSTDSNNGDLHPSSGRNSPGSTAKQEKDEDREQTTTYLRSPYWWAGILLMTVGEAGNFLAYGFAPASIVSPLGVVALVSNCIIAPCLLKEPFRQRDFWGVLVAVGGAVTIVLSAKTSENRMGPHDIWVAITRWEFELYLGISGAVIVTLVWASSKYGQRSILIDLGLVGLFGGYTALSTKGVASVLSDSLWRALTFPITYLLVFVLVATALLQIHYVNRALQRFDSTQVIPTQFVLFTISVIIGSAILYRDFESATVDRVAKFFGGCALTFLGVYLITSGRPQDTRGDEDGDADDEEGRIGLIDEEAEMEEQEGGDYDVEHSRQDSRTSATLHNNSTTGDTQEMPRQDWQKRMSVPDSPQKFDSAFSATSSQPATPSSAAFETPLLENPWHSQRDYQSVRQPMRGSVSSPQLPKAQGQASHHRGSGDPGPPTADRPPTLSRHSIARMLPGPYWTPLSSSLSAVVADSLRRGADPRARRRQRPGLADLAQSRSQRHTDDGSGDVRPPLKSAPARGSRSDESSAGKGRSLSLGTTFGELFHFGRGQRSVADRRSSHEP